MNKVVPLFLFCFFLATFIATAQQVDALIPLVNGQVGSIQQSGDTVYIGGNFTTVGGLPRKNLAAFNATTGQVLNWAPSPNNIADIIGISKGNLVVQGSFDTIAGQPRNTMAQFNLVTGSLTSWHIDSKTAIYVGYSSMYNDTIYTITSSLTAIDAVSGNILWSNPSSAYSNSYIYPSAIEAAGDTIYFAHERELLAVDRARGQTIYWRDTLDQQVIYDIAAANGKVFIAGTFDSINNIPRTGVAQLDMNGNVTSWNAYSTSHCLSLAIQGNYIYVGGFFSSIGQNFIYDNYRLGKLDITTAQEMCWDINKTTETESTINLIYTYDTMVYVSGALSSNGYLFSAANSPCANLCLTVEGNKGCTGVNGTITISGSETGVTYQAYSGTTAVGATVTGNGSIIILTIPAANLDSGSNAFSIQAARQGCTAFLKNTATINVTKGSLPSANIFFSTIAETGAPQFICPPPFPLVNTFGLYGFFDPNTNYTVLATPAYQSSEVLTPQNYIEGGYSLNVNYSILAPGVNILSIVASNACGHVYLNEIDTVTYLSPAYINSATLAPSSICQGVEKTITINNSAKNLYYEFSISSGGTTYGAGSGTGNGGNLDVYINTYHLPAGNITVEVSTPYSVCPSQSTNLGPITLLPAPKAPLPRVVTGDTVLCESNQSVTFSAPSGYASYQWGLADGTGVSLVSTDSTYTFFNNSPNLYRNYQSSSWSVFVTGANGCSSLNPYYVPYGGNVTNYPGRTISSGYGMDSTITYTSSSFCSNDSVKLTAVNYSQLNYFNGQDTFSPFTYQWLLNDTAVPNATGLSFYPKQSGTYSVLLKSPGGCTAQSQPLQITENPLPVALASSIESGFADSSIVLQSPFPTGQVFSWSPAFGLNDSTLASPSFTPLQNGTYSFVAKATDNNGCSNTDTVKVDVTGVTGAVKGTANNPVKVYPNPYSGFTNITYQLSEQSSVTAEVFNIIGEQLSQFVNELQEPGAYHYQFTGSVSGMYIVKITINNKEYYQKVVQQ